MKLNTSINLAIKLVLIGQFIGCAELFTNRTFIDEMDRETEGFFVPTENFRVMSGDSGKVYRNREEISKRTPASFRSKEEMDSYLSIQKELRRKENTLSPSDYRVYIENSELFESPSEKIYYLDLSENERLDYLRIRQKGSLYSKQNRIGNEAQSQFYVQDFYRPRYKEKSIHVGMTKDDVKGYWGRPHRVEVAGDPSYQNERWVFVHNGQVNYVFFEAGKVNGWSID